MTGTARQTRLVKTEQACGELRAIARAALRSGLAAGALVSRRTGTTVIPALVQDPDRIGADAYFGAPIMPQNAASILSDVTFRPPKGRVLAVLRSCEHRALIELAKLKQVDLDSILVIGVDCLGAAGPGAAPPDLLDQTSWRARMAEGGAQAWEGVRQACGICVLPAATAAALTVGLIGVSPESGVLLSVPDDDDGRRLLEAVAAEDGASASEPGDEVASRAAAVTAVADQRGQAKASAIAAWRDSTGSFAALSEALAACTRCPNCRRACPICYCRECVFETALFESTGDRYLARAARKGAVRLPAEVMLYQLTRLAHMGLSCVSCGMCEAYCPAGIELSMLFAAMGQDARELFAYDPGRDVGEALPLTVYREDELNPR